MVLTTTWAFMMKSNGTGVAGNGPLYKFVVGISLLHSLVHLGDLYIVASVDLMGWGDSTVI